jgi:hypothetical protein
MLDVNGIWLFKVLAQGSVAGRAWVLEEEMPGFESLTSEGLFNIPGPQFPQL